MQTASQTITYLAFWSLTGIVLFSIYVVAAFRSGLVYTARKQDGMLKERPPLSGVLALWRPAFLNLPDEPGRESMGRHMFLSIPVGLAAVV